MPVIARNDLCPCGSGRKYKHCCGALPVASAQTPPAPAQTPPLQPASAPVGQERPPNSVRTYDPAGQPTRPNDFEEWALGFSQGALAGLIKQGRLGEAEQRASALLQRHPHSGALWNILGVALGRQGKEALPALRRAAELLPDDDEVHRNLGTVLLARGQPEEALVSLRRSLELRPRDVLVLMAVANTLGALGRAREAVPLYERALEIDPHSADVRNNLGNALQELGEPAKAVDCYRQALAIKPDDAEIHSNLGNALRQLGELPEAVASGQRAIALQPGLAAAHNNLGLALAAVGQREEAVASFGHAVALDPRFIEALNNLGNVLRDLGRHREALPLYARAVSLDPQRADIHVNLGNARYESREVALAEASFRRALQLRPDSVPGHLGLAAALRLQGRSGEAEASCRAALAIEPNSVAALSMLADVLGDRGEFEQALELSERALAIDSSFPPVFCSIAAHRKMTSADTAWLQGAQALLAKRLPLDHEIALRFALAKYHDDLREYDQAFGEYRNANELSKRAGLAYERAKLSQHVDQIIRTFGAAFASRSHARASASELPVFIVGMPRSGTSLTEQILASHPEASGAGEVRFWDSALETFRAEGPSGHARQSVFERIARDYLGKVAAAAGTSRRVVDKMPANFLYAGLIHAVFPRARILHMQRHPIDTCLSIYFQNFVATSPYASDLDDLAHYYGEYVRITNHWRSVLPASVWLEVPYEALIEDQEGWTRRMLDFVGLPWDPRCLEFERTERIVLTFSRWQVRQKIGAGSVGRWRNYEKYVAPLRALMDLEIIQPPRAVSASMPGRPGPP
jgi:tetratricopeptide (TPR) repeat protein